MMLPFATAVRAAAVRLMETGRQVIALDAATRRMRGCACWRAPWATVMSIARCAESL